MPESVVENVVAVTEAVTPSPTVQVVQQIVTGETAPPEEVVAVVTPAPLVSTVVVNEIAAHAAVSAQGPAGPRGATGDGIFAVEEFLLTDPVPSSIILDHVPTAGTVRLYINGIRQGLSEFSVAGSTVSLPGALSLEGGDTITLEYLFTE